MSCRDYTVTLKNGYTYEHWGNNFIAYYKDGEQRQAIEGQVDDYAMHGDLLVAIQTTLGNPKAPPVYWIIDTSTHQKERFTDKAVFIQKITALGISPDVLAPLKS